MKPAPFSYASPEALGEALALLAGHGSDAKLLAGGQSLVPLLNLRLARPEVVIDLNRVPGLDELSVNGSVRLGPLVRQQDALGLGEVPLLAAALRSVGHVASRCRGTVAGSIAHADPAAEIPAVLLALDGAVTVRSIVGERTIAAPRLFTGPFTTSLRPDEMIVGVNLPRTGANDRHGFHEVARRHGDFAVAGAACRVQVADGVIERAAIALFGVGATAVRATEAEARLVGTRPGDAEAIRAVAACAASGLEPPDDIHASGVYRRRMAEVAVRRALEQAGADDA